MLGALLGGIGSIVGGLIGSNSASKAADKNYAAQKEFAQQGVRWKVEDAKRAGIHPLYALGANTVSFSPSFVGDTGLPNAIAQTGQDIGRAIDAGRTGDERLGAVNKTAQDLTLTRMGLENELLAAQIRKVNQAGHPPGMPGGSAFLPGVGGLTAVTIGGRDIVPHPGWSDAETITNRYGEPAEWVYSPGVMAADAWRNFEKDIRGAITIVPGGVADRVIKYFGK